MKKLSTRELAQYLNVTKRTIQRRAIKENWAFEETIGLGGTKRLYHFATLPEAIKSKVIANIIARHESHGGSDDDYPVQIDSARQHPFILSQQQSPQDWLAQHCHNHKTRQSELNKNFLKLGLLALAREYVKQSGQGKIKGFDEFCQQYNDRLLSLDSLLYNTISHISRISLLRWEKKEQQLAFADDAEGGSAVDGAPMDKELTAIAEEILMVSPDITAKRMRQHFLTFFADKKIPDEQQLKTWLRQAKA